MKIDWKRKLSSRKFWAMLGGFVAAVMAFLGASDTAVTQVVSILSAAGVIIAYIFAEGFTDAAYAENKESGKEGADGTEQK